MVKLPKVNWTKVGKFLYNAGVFGYVKGKKYWDDLPAEKKAEYIEKAMKLLGMKGKDGE